MKETPSEGPMDPDHERRWNAALAAVERGQAKFVSPGMIEFTPPGGFTPEEQAVRLDSYLRLKHSYNKSFFEAKSRQRAEDAATWRRLRAEGL